MIFHGYVSLPEGTPTMIGIWDRILLVDVGGFMCSTIEMGWWSPMTSTDFSGSLNYHSKQGVDQWIMGIWVCPKEGVACQYVHLTGIIMICMYIHIYIYMYIYMCIYLYIYVYNMHTYILWSIHITLKQPGCPQWIVNHGWSWGDDRGIGQRTWLRNPAPVDSRIIPW